MSSISSIIPKPELFLHFLNTKKPDPKAPKVQRGDQPTDGSLHKAAASYLRKAIA